MTGVVIPAYRAEATVGDVVRSVRAMGLPVVVVDDGSPDRAAACAAEAGADVVRMNENGGKGTALWAGFQRAHELGWGWVVAMDADGQHDPASLPAFLDRRGGRDGIVVGARKLSTPDMPWPRVCSNRLTTALLSLQAGCRLWDSQCGYRMYRLEAVLRSGLPNRGRFEWESEALVRVARAGWSIGRVDVPTIYGEAGSHIRPWRDTMRFVALWLRLWKVVLFR
jgi:glycosyltransferase involved in cell wall biosynthesis